MSVGLHLGVNGAGRDDYERTETHLSHEACARVKMLTIFTPYSSPFRDGNFGLFSTLEFWVRILGSSPSTGCKGELLCERYNHSESAFI